MSENNQTVQPGDGCMVHAGILTSHGGNVSNAQLTKGYKNSATEKFIDEVINELINPNTDPLPCGKPIPPLDPKLAEVFKDLKDEKKFPDFHEKILGYYRDLARSLEASSAFNLFPVCDPVALGSQLFPNNPIKIEKLSDFLKFATPNPVGLAAEFAKAGVTDPVIKEKTGIDVPLTPVGLIATFTKKVAANEIKTTPIPPIPPVPPTQPQLISGGSTVANPWQGVEQQTLQPYDTRGPDLAAQIGSFGINIGKFLPQLIASMPVFVISMITKGPAAALNTVCGLVADDSGLLGVGVDDSNGRPQDIVMRAARKVLARKITEMCVFNAMASTIGTSTSGLVGLMAGGAKDKLVTENKSGLAADYNTASKDTQNLLIEGKQATYAEGQSYSADDYITFTNPPEGIDIDDPEWRTSLSLGEGNKPYAPRGGDANDDQTFDLEAMKNSGDARLIEFAEHNEKSINEKQEEPKTQEQKDQDAINQTIRESVQDPLVPDDIDDYLPQKEPDPPPPPEVPEKEPEVDNPFEPRGYDLPKDVKVDSKQPAVPPGLPAGTSGASPRALIVSKAIEGAGLIWSRQPDAYSSFLFAAEYAQNARAATLQAKFASSCGVFARACYAAGGATYYFNPKQGGWRREYKGPKPSPVNVAEPNDQSGEVGKKIGPQVVVVNYFTDKYPIESVNTAFIQIGRKRGALKFDYGRDKKMCKLEPGDVIIMSNVEHVTLCISSFDPLSDKYFDAVEGGQTDAGNKITEKDIKNKLCSYVKEPGKMLSSAYMPSRFFWNGSNGSVSDHPAASKATPLKKDFSQKPDGVYFKGGVRQLWYVIDADKFING